MECGQSGSHAAPEDCQAADPEGDGIPKLFHPPLDYLDVSDDYEGCANDVCGHVGTDYSVTDGSNLYASSRGTVIVADWCSLPNSCKYDGTLSSPEANRGYGNVIIIEYSDAAIPEALRAELELEAGESVFFVYGHLSDILVEPGDLVEPGQIIGHTGDTGNSTAAHLHLEVRTGPSGSIPVGEMCGDVSCFNQNYIDDINPNWAGTVDPNASYSYLLDPSITRHDPADVHEYYDW